MDTNNKKNERRFSGPLFIFGMPRSGTKLLRDLLNRNERISIPVSESHFIPYLVGKYGFDYDLSDKDNRQRIQAELVNTSYCFFLKHLGTEFDADEWLNSKEIHDWAGLFEYLLRHGGECQSRQDVICGDKTPGYIRHIKLLKRIFPDCKFIHIVRDPRDYALSCRKSWGKNIYRAAERWRETLQVFDVEASQLGQEELATVLYEDLLENPEEELRKLCDFLEVVYSSEMLHLHRSLEQSGDAKGSTEIVKNNKEKYLRELKQEEVRRIEEIVYPVAPARSYKLHFAERFVPLRKHEKAFYRLADAGAILRYYTNALGVYKGMYVMYIHHKKSSWQNQFRL